MAVYQILRTGSFAPTYTVSDGVYSKVILLNGTGLPPIRRKFQEHPHLEGAVDYGYYFEPREMTLRIFYSLPTKALADARRDQIYNIFQPNIGTESLILRVTRNDGKIRQINCHAIGVNDFPESTRVGYDQVIDIRLLAPDPIWTEPTTWTLTGTPASGNHNFNFTNFGDWEVWPTIKVYGQVTNCTINLKLTLPDASIRNHFLFFGTISAGDIYTFETNPAIKTGTNSAGETVMIQSPAQDLFGLFYIKLFAHPEALNGINLINITSSARDGTHKLQLIYQPRYLGL